MKIDRQKVYEKYGGRCAYCGREITLSQMQVDHIWPQFSAHFRPGYDIHCFENLNPACARCNKWKATFKVDEFRREIELQLERLRERSSNYRMAKDFGLVVENESKVQFYFEKP